MAGTMMLETPAVERGGRANLVAEAVQLLSREGIHGMSIGKLRFGPTNADKVILRDSNNQPRHKEQATDKEHQ